MTDKRIIQLTERQTLESGDYVALDNSTDGSHKYQLDKLTYSLPTMAANVKGGAKVGSGLSVADDTLSLSGESYTSAEKSKLAGVEANANNYSLPTMSAGTKGGAKLGAGLAIASDVLGIADSGVTQAMLASGVKSGVYDGMYAGGAGSLSGEAQDATFTSKVSDADGLARVEAVKGNTIVWNQLVNTGTSSVTIPSGHKYIKRISGTATLATSDGTAFSVTGGTDNVFNLTLMFGSGNEPSTVAEFKALYPEDYYPYDAGSLLSVNIEGIRTTDAQGNSLDAVSFPAVELRSAGSAYDEMTADKRYTRIGVVDLGTLNWQIATTSVPDKHRYVSIDINTLTKPPIDSTTVANVICAKYASTTPTSNYNGIEGVSINNGNGNVLVYDESLSSSTVKQFKTAMSGVYLYYELATPTTTPIEPPLDMTYRVEDGGTESVTPTTGNMTAPVPLSVCYPETTGDIRDDALATIAPVENGKASTNYAVNSYLCHNGKLYRVTSAIASGESITPGTNCTAVTVMSELVRLTN